MMKIHPIASGSGGNAILVDDGASKLLLDAGLPYSKLTEGLLQYDTRPSELSGVLVTHEHMDHCKGVSELIRRGVPAYMSEGTFRELLGRDRQPSGSKRLGMDPIQVGITIVKGENLQAVGSWFVVPFDVNHDAAEPLGFLFQSQKTGAKGVYIVDSAIVDFTFTGVTHWLIECNHTEAELAGGTYPEVAKKRIGQNHMSLENLQRFLEGEDTSCAEQVCLLHLSDAHSDEQGFVDKIQRATGVPTYAF